MDSKFEAKLVVQALRINTLSKLTFSDCARFNALMKDVFPGIEFKDIEYEELAEAIRSVCKEANLRVNEIQVGTHYPQDWLSIHLWYLLTLFSLEDCKT